MIEKYKQYNTLKYYELFKTEFKHETMHITSYRRVLYGDSTYINSKQSPYVADIIEFIAEQSGDSFLEVAYELIDKEYLGRKNTFLDVYLAENHLTVEDIPEDIICTLKNIRLCDYNENNAEIYKLIQSKEE